MRTPPPPLPIAIGRATGDTIVRDTRERGGNDDDARGGGGVGGGGAGSGRDDDATMTRVRRSDVAREGATPAMTTTNDEDDANDAAANDDVVVVVVDGNDERDAPASSCDITASPIPPKIAIAIPPPSTRPAIDHINNARRDENILDDIYRMRNGSGVSNIEPIALTRSSMFRIRATLRITTSTTMPDCVVVIPSRAHFRHARKVGEDDRSSSRGG